ncbi:MAG: hypothetical protein ABIV28_09420 [Longimicrobiales bacterium]
MSSDGPDVSVAPRNESAPLAPSPTRQVEVDGVVWIATLSGRCAAGSGALGLGMLESIDFANASAPDRTMRVALVQRSRFHHLFDAELIALFATSKIVT